jgi:hypothetical protein
METDKEMEVLRVEFSGLNEVNKGKVVDMMKFLVLTQNTIIPGFLREKGLGDTSPQTQGEIKPGGELPVFPA